jgi:hypothetical protein
MAKLSNEPVAGFEEPSGDFSSFFERQDKLLKDLQDKEAALPEGTYEGVILRFPHADGYAMYLVAKTSPLTLQHIPYGDAWELPAAHLRGVNLADVKAQAERNKAARSFRTSRA